MTTATEHDMPAAAAVVRTYCDAWLAGDTMAVLSLYHDDLTLLWPGNHRFAGVHVGQAAAIDALLGLQAVTNRVPIEVLDVMTGHTSVMMTVHEHWSIGSEIEGSERSIEVLRSLEYSVVDGKLHTCRVYESDQPAIDAWLAATDDELSEESDVDQLLDWSSAGWASGDVEAILECFAADAVFHNHGAGEPVVGTEALRIAFTTILERNVGLSSEKQRVVFGPDHAVVEYVVSATIDDTLMTAPAVDVFYFRDGLIAEKHTWVTQPKAA